jgi:hypothetical protein
MKQKDGTYAPEGIQEGTKGCESCLDPEAETVRLTGYDGVYFDICRNCWRRVGYIALWHLHDE